MRYPQTFPPSVSPTPCQCNRTIPYQVRRYPAARNLIRGRPPISVRQQTGNRNEWPLSGRLTLPGNGEDGRIRDITAGVSNDRSPPEAGIGRSPSRASLRVRFRSVTDLSSSTVSIKGGRDASTEHQV